MPSYTQTGRPMQATTPLPADTLLLDRLSGSEGMSRPYELTLDFLSLDGAIDSQKLLKKAIGVTVEIGGQKRFFHGLVRRFSQHGRDAEKLVTYRAEVVPWLWFLSLSTHYRVYQNKSVPDIVKAVFSDLGMTDFKLSLTGSYSPREYCVQYHETDLDFVSRLLEEEGIYYYFDHTASKHTMVLVDSPSGIAAGPKLSAASSETGNFGTPYITSLELEHRIFTGKVALGDYNMETPSLSLSTTTTTAVQGIDNHAFEYYEYPGRFLTKSDGEKITKLRMEEREALNLAVRGQANTIVVTSGAKLEIADYYRKDVNKSYQVLSVDHTGWNGGYRSSEGGAAEFTSNFVAIPSTVPYRPPRTTPKAVVRGVQTAVVVGPKGEEIYVDKYGRVKVQFFWDRIGQKNEGSSCWVRVSSTWAGKSWGAIQTPRIGQEVIVDFLEGDPDRPIITGRVYNAEQMPPYALPDNATQSGVKSRSSKQATPEFFNELRFEDKKDAEQIYLHAQKDFETIVENDQTIHVMHDRKKTVDNDETVEVKGNRTEKVSKDEKIEILGNRTETVTKDETITITGSRTETVSKDEKVTISDGDRSLTVSKGKETISIKGDRSVTVTDGNESLAVKKGNLATEVGMGNVETKVKMGNVSLKADLGTISNEAMQSFEIKVGSNSIKVDQTGVTIKGLMVKIEGSVQTDVKGLMTTVAGDAMLTVKGGITMIN